MTRRDYLLAELRCASLRAQLMLADIEAIHLALEGGLITPEQAVELLGDCDLFRFIEPAPPTQPDTPHKQAGDSRGPEWAETARQFHEDRKRSAPKPVPSKVRL
jgi:hypothetical protein